MRHSSNYIHILNMLIDKNIKVLSNLIIGEDAMQFTIEYSKDFYKCISLKYMTYISYTREVVEESFMHHSQVFKYDNSQLLILEEEIKKEYTRLFNDLKNNSLSEFYFTDNFKININNRIKNECTN